MTSNEERICSSLQKLGFTPNEAKVLVTLMKLQESNTKTLIELSGVRRNKIYDVLAKLKQNNLIIDENPQGDVRVFKIIDPKNQIFILKESYIQEIEESADYALKGLKEISSTMKDEVESTQEIWTLKGSKSVFRTLQSMLISAKASILCGIDINIFEKCMSELLAKIDEGLEVKVVLSEFPDNQDILSNYSSNIHILTKHDQDQFLNMFSRKIDFPRPELMEKLLSLIFSDRPNIVVIDNKSPEQNSMLILHTQGSNVDYVAVHLLNKEFIQFQALSLERIWEFSEIMKSISTQEN